MKKMYRCTGYRVVEEGEDKGSKVDCVNQGAGDKMFLKTWVTKIENPTADQVIAHALCEECCDLINAARVENGLRRRNFPRMAPCLTKATATQKAVGYWAEEKGCCSYCGAKQKLAQMKTEEMQHIRRRIQGKSPTAEQVIKHLLICTGCEKRLREELPGLVPAHQLVASL